ncbi:MAG: hypothetical protein VYC47_01510 [Verrucomicrobiota bacterium]|nr:hypothetical protein [Verrucomicrobiota bacterium]
MKLIRSFNRSGAVSACVFAVLIATPRLAKAEITGQWNFTDGLAAEIGQDLEWNYEQGDAKLGKASELKAKPINGEDPMVLSFPNSDPESEFSGLDVYHGGEPNGGSDWLLNQYTVVMDLFYSVRSNNKPRALIALNDFEGPQLLVSTSNGIGSRSFHGKLRPNRWHRVALTVDHVSGEANYFVDGVHVGTEQIGKSTDDDGRLAMEDLFYLFKHPSESYGGFISSLQFRDEAVPASVIEALGLADAAGIPSEPPAKPYLVSVTPKPTPFRRPVPTDILPNTIIQSTWKDGKASMKESTAKLHLNGQALDTTAKRTGDMVTISAMPEALLDPLGNYEVLVTFDDSNGESHSKQWRFTVTDFQKLSADIALPIGVGSEPGFLVRSAQATAEAAIRHDYSRAIHQLEGILIDATGNAVENVAYPPEGNGEFDLMELVDFQKEGSIFGHFEMEEYFPGIPGEEDHDTNFSTEVLTYLALKAGTHRLGVTVHVAKPDQNDEDRFKVFVGASARDRFAQEIGSFELTLLGFRDGPNETTFDFTVGKEGLYPFRIVYWNKSRNAALEFYSVDLETGERILINDAENDAAIKAYSSAGQVRQPYVALAGPAPGTSGNSKETPISIVLADDETKVDAASVKLYVNRRLAKPSVTKDGRHTHIEFQPEHKSLSELDYNVKLTFDDSAGNNLTREWSFSVDARDEIEITGYWNFGSKLKAAIGSDLAYLDGPNGATASATEFGTTTDFGLPDIGGKPASVMKVGHVGSNANFGYLMEHGVSPNGGGKKINQYTLICDVFFTGTGSGWASMLNMDGQGDGDVFWRRGDGGLGQGGGGYEPDDPEIKVNKGQWHRIVLAVDLAKGVYEKYVDGQYHSAQANAGLDGRQSMKPSAWLFNDNDGENGEVYVAAVQVRNGKVSRDEAKALGAASALGIPMPTPVRGLWSFDEGDLSATLGQTLGYLDGAKGSTAGATDFDTTESFGIDGIDGQTANVMKIGHVGSNANFGYLMTHNIEPNGGGKRVNQFTLAFDIYFSGNGGGWASLANFDNKGDGDVFWRRGDGGIGQGGGGYEPDDPEVKVNTGQWHRIVLAFDLAAGSYKKYVDGTYHSSQANGGLDGRQSMGATAWLFNDNDGENGEVYVGSIAVYERELTADEAATLGLPKASGIPTGLESAPEVLDLFFFQYAEGSSYNKLLEIRNPTDLEIDLSGYAFPNQNHGANDAESFDYWNSFPEGATVAPGGNYIIAHPDADPAIVAVADQFHKYLSNGDDAYALVKGTKENYEVIDVIGDIAGDDPGSGWSVAGVSNATKDHTLIRKDTVNRGNTDWAASAGTTPEDSEWIILGKDVWDGIKSIPTISVNRQADGAIRIEFEGKLESSANATGPWEDIDASSPTSITASEARQFYRARN